MKRVWEFLARLAARWVEPASGDPILAQRQLTLNLILLGLILPTSIFCVTTLVLFALGYGPLLPAISSLGIGLVNVLAYLAGRRGWLRIATIVPLGTLLAGLYVSMSSSRLFLISISGMAVLVTIAALLLGTRGTFLFLLLSLVVYLLAPSYGPLASTEITFATEATSAYNILGLSFTLLAVLGLNWLAVRQAKQSAQLERQKDRIEQERDFAEGMINTAHAFIVVLDHEGHVLRVNPFTERTTGYSAAEVTGQDWFKTFLPRREQSRLRGVFSRIKETGGVHREVNLIKTKDGRELMVEWHSSTLLDTSSNATAILAIGIDLTDQLQAREAASTREAQMASLFRVAPMGIGLIKDRTFLLINDQFCDMLGYSPEEVIGQSSRFIYPDDEEYERVGLEVYGAVRERGIGIAETRMIRKDGTIISVLESVTPVDPDDPDGEMTFTTQDITLVKQAEEELRLAEYSIDQAGEAILWIGADGKLMRANPTACRLLHFQEDELLQLQHFSIREGLQESDWKAHWERLAAAKSIVERTRWRRKDGRLIPVEVSASFFSFEGTEYILVFARDISELIRTEDLIRRRTNYLAALNQASARVSRWGLDLEGVLSAIVTNLVEIVGLSIARIWLVDETTNELVLKASAGQSTKLVGPQDRISVEHDQSKISQVFLKGKPFVTNDVQIDPAFNRSWAEQEGIVSFAGYPLYSNSNPIAMIAIFHDEPLDEIIQDVLGSFANQTAITVRNAQLFAALEISESNYRGIFEGIQDAILIEDLNGSIVDVNRQACRMYGYEHDEFLRKTLLDLVPSQSHAIQPASLLSEGAIEQPIETINIRANGEPFPVEITTRLHTLEGQQVMLVVVRDITERKESERLIYENEERFRSITETAIDGIVIADEAGFIRYANNACSQMFEHPPEDMTNCPLSILFPEEVWHQHASTLLSHGKEGAGAASGQTIELEGLKSGGSLFPVQLSLSSYKLDHGAYFSAIIRDMSEAKETQTRVMAQERLAAIGQLAAGIAHDFNNIMAAIILYAQMLQREAHISEPSRNRLERIRAQAHRGSDLISQILDFSRQSMIELQPTDLAAFLRELHDLLRRTLPENIDLAMELAEEPCVVNADTGRMQQIILNLVTNARDALPKGGHLRISLDKIRVNPGTQVFEEMNPGDWVRLQVTDDGVGIPPENLTRIFEPFFTTKKAGKGTGLGLAQVYGIVKQHQGFIAVESEPDQGTAFIMHFPHVNAQELERPQSETDDLLEADLRVLLVEDDDSVRVAVSDMLELFGCVVTEAKTGQDALDVLAASREKIDLVLSDMVMPTMGGRQLFEAVHTNYPNVNFILMTGYPLGHDTGELIDKRYAVLLRKPFTAQELGDAVLASRKRAQHDRKARDGG